MPPFLEKAQETLAPYGAYIAVAMCVLPLIYMGRKYTWPVIAFVIEVGIFSVALHLFLFGLFTVATWFRGATTVRFLADGTQVAIKPMATPLLEFWKKELYSPEAIFYVEIVCFLAIVYAVYWLRPMSLDRRNTYKGKVPQGGKKKKAPLYSGSNLSARPRFAKKKAR